jgi:dienelactone hydrolase
MIRRRSIVLCAAAILLVAACSSSRAATPTPTTAATATTTATTNAATTTAPTTSVAPTTTIAATTTTIDPADVTAYEAAGPSPVGVTTAALANGIKVEIWYPAVAGSNGTETYDARDFTAPALKAILTASIPATVSYAATRDAAVADGKFPVVLYSHGVSGFRDVSSFLTAHLASWGMIVVAPDHPSRDLYHLAAGPKIANPTNSVDDLLQSLDLIIAKGSTAGDPFQGHVDADRIGAMGHSAGGGTVLAAASDPRIDGYVSMASGLFRATSGAPDFSGSTTTTTPTDATTTTTAPIVPPDKPSFFLGGSLDHVADPARTHAAFVAVPAPSLYWKIDGVGHNGFDDLCTLGNGKGIIGIAEASGLGAFLDAQPLFRTLGQDGCLPPAAPVATTQPIIRHAVTAWFLQLFGTDTTPRGLGPDGAGSYAEPVTIEVR